MCFSFWSTKVSLDSYMVSRFLYNHGSYHTEFWFNSFICTISLSKKDVILSWLLEYNFTIFILGVSSLLSFFCVEFVQREWQDQTMTQNLDDVRHWNSLVVFVVESHPCPPIYNHLQNIAFWICSQWIIGFSGCGKFSCSPWKFSTSQRRICFLLQKGFLEMAG